jgi:hypothetical protein
MKKANITISFEDRKLDSLRFFMEKENSSPQKELEEALTKIYERYVPDQMREYFASRPSSAAKAKAKHSSKAAANKRPAPVPSQKPEAGAGQYPMPAQKEGS